MSDPIHPGSTAVDGDPRSRLPASPEQGPIAWWASTPDVAIAELGSAASLGLTSAAAAARRAVDGPNELVEAATKPAWRVFLGQFASTMIIVLLGAGLVMALIGDLTDAAVIAAVIVLNALIGFGQEHRAERAMAALRQMTQPLARVVRDGVVKTVRAGDIVRGDILHLDAGDLVAADARLIDAPNLQVNEAALTGESVPVEKTADILAPGEGQLVADRRNMVFRGTAIAYGRGRAVVTATGMHTALGEIAGLLQSHAAPPTPLQRQLAVLGRWIAIGAIAICILVFVIGVARGEPIDVMFFTALSLAVAAIPESLPAVVTVSLALGAHRMAKQHALIRKLSAVETLGSVTVVASDKTGTLTQGRMSVERLWTLAGSFRVSGDGYEPRGIFEGADGEVESHAVRVLDDLVLAAALCNDASLVPPDQPGAAWGVSGDPTEGALLALAGRAGLDRAATIERHPRVAELAFDSERRRMTTVHSASDGRLLVASKGALEAVLPIVTQIADRDGERPITSADRDLIRAAAEADSAAGYRVLAVGGGRLASSAGDPPASLGAVERDLVLYGLVALADPPRSASADAVAAARSAGITPIMVTGDHPATARAIATRLGILTPGRAVMTGAELESEGPEHLARHVGDVAVYARTTPEQKLDIVAAWQARGAVVAMTGDGVNDAPALRKADIGVAMGISGTEVSKEAADMVLANDNFATIIGAVREGRRIYDNIRRSVRFGLTGGSGEIWLIFLAPFVGLPLPLLPIQILWVNLVTHGLPGVALAVEPAEPDVMRHRPRPRDEAILSGGLWQHILFDGLLLGAVCLGIGLWGYMSDRPWQTMVFTALALLQLGNALALRSNRQSVFRLGLRGNPFLLLVLVGTLVLQLILIYWSPAQRLLSTEALSPLDLTVVLIASTFLFWVVEIQKLISRRSSRALPVAPSRSLGTI